jgi:hypothetical protein
MINLTSLPALFSLLAFAVSAGEQPNVDLTVEPCINGEVSASGLFPTHAMEDAFAAYLDWTEDQDLSRLVAFEPVIADGVIAGGQFPTRRMEEQFVAYMRWVDEQGLSPFYAFVATDFD